MKERRTIVIRYDEIGLKGKNRDFFVSRLVNNIKEKLAGLQIIQYRSPRGRILIDLKASSAEESAKRLRLIPGVASFSIGMPMQRDFQEIADLGVEWIEPLLAPGKGLKFCVRTQRSDKSFFKTSPECNFEIGSRIMTCLHDKGLVVDIENAQFVMEVEIGYEETIAFSARIPGLRGLPVGSSGNILSLLSGGIDSPVASFMLIRRGCRAHFIFFENRAFLGRGGYDKVVRLARVVNRFQTGGRLYVIPFGDVQIAIRDHCRPAHRVVLYRRMMYRIAHRVAEKHKYLALVTGESLGQVASQTLENLAAVSCVVPISVFRPLIGTDKVDIVSRAREIGTFDISVEPQADCCTVFMPDNPVTRSKISELESDEALFPWEKLMEEALGKIETLELDAPT